VIWAGPLGVPLLMKSAPAAGATVAGSAVTFTRTAVPEEGYWVCCDTTDNGTCDTTWWPNGAATAKVLSGLTSGTYYWQVRTSDGGVLADNGAWHAFTVSTTTVFTKHTPANGATGLGSTVTLQWTAVPDEGYWVCWDTIDNGTCDTTWWPNGAMTAKVVSELTAATYYWQVRTSDGGVLADYGTWHHFTVAAEPVAVASSGWPGIAAFARRGRDGRPMRGGSMVAVAATAVLLLTTLVAGPLRRRRVVAAGVAWFVLGPAAALAQSTTQIIEYYTTDAIGSVRAVTKQVDGTWQVVARHDFMAASARQPLTASYGEPRRSAGYFGAARRRAVRGRGRAAPSPVGQAALHGERAGQRDRDGLLRSPVLPGQPRAVYDGRSGATDRRCAIGSPEVESLHQRDESPARTHRSRRSLSFLFHALAEDRVEPRGAASVDMGTDSGSGRLELGDARVQFAGWAGGRPDDSGVGYRSPGAIRSAPGAQFHQQSSVSRGSGCRGARRRQYRGTNAAESRSPGRLLVGRLGRSWRCCGQHRSGAQRAGSDPRSWPSHHRRVISVWHGDQGAIP
jgi:hypothetical protein